MPRRQRPPDDFRVSELRSDGRTLAVSSWSKPAAPPQRPISPEALATLTPALRAIHACLLLGLSDAEMAAVRNTSRSVVTKQVNAVYKALGVGSRRELLARS